MRAAGLRSGVTVDEVAFNRYFVFILGVVEEARAAAAAGILGYHVALDSTRHIDEREACTSEFLIGTDVVVNEVVGDVEALRFIEVADDGLRIAADLEAVDGRELAVLGAGIFDAQERPAFAFGLAYIRGRVTDLEALAALEAAGKREVFLARRKLLGIAPLSDANYSAGACRFNCGCDRLEWLLDRTVSGLACCIHEVRAPRNCGRAGDCDGARRAGLALRQEDDQGT